MEHFFFWTYALFACLIAVAVVRRAVRIALAVRSGMKTPPSGSRPAPGERLRKDWVVFFQKTLAGVLHTVLAVSFLLMALDAFALLFRLLSSVATLETAPQGVLPALNRLFAAAAIAAAAVLLARRVFARIPRYATLTRMQRWDGYAVLLLEMASAGSLLLVYTAMDVRTAFGLHYGIMLVFAWYITFSKHLHVFTAPLYLVTFGRRETFAPDDMPEVLEGLEVLQGTAPTGAAMPERMGARDASDLTRGRLLSAFSCTQCGRCDQVCPSVPLWQGTFSPRQVMAQVRRCALHPQQNPLYGQRIDPQQAFACIGCGACLQACPVAISPMDVLLQLRRYASLEQGDAPAEYAQASAALSAVGNPWGLGKEHAKDEIPMPVADPRCPPDYLLWRGSMGLYDAQGRRSVAALARALTAAGVRWAALAPEQECDTADILRYTGDELAFLSSARRNIETLARYGVKNIVTPCPHSWSVFKNQYPSLGGRYRVWHASEFVMHLVDNAKLSLPRTLEGRTVTYHDPCRLSRSRLTQAPRRLLAALGANLVEVPQSGERSMCCGAGDYFRRNDTPVRIASRRMEQLAGSGADAVVTACPFCLQMLSRPADGIPVTDIMHWVEV